MSLSKIIKKHALGQKTSMSQLLDAYAIKNNIPKIEAVQHFGDWCKHLNSSINISQSDLCRLWYIDTMLFDTLEYSETQLVSTFFNR